MHRLAGGQWLSCRCWCCEDFPSSDASRLIRKPFACGAPGRPREREEVPMPIVGGLDIHRKQITFDYLDADTGQVRRGQISPADRVHLRAWLARFAGREDVAFALEACTGWRYIAEELAAAGFTVHLAHPAHTALAPGPQRHAKSRTTRSPPPPVPPAP